MCVWGHRGGILDVDLALEVVVEDHEILEFVGIFEKVSFDDEAEELDQHEVFGVYFAYCIEEFLKELLIEGGTMLDFLFLGQLKHQFGCAHLLSKII